jgi:hypothetical protein
MDQKQEELVKQIESLGRDILEFKEGERVSAKVPKWAKIRFSWMDIDTSKWYPISGKDAEGLFIYDNGGDKRHIDMWDKELCYSDNLPEEKKCAQGPCKLGPEELIQTGDIVVWEDQSICSMEEVEDLAGIPTSSLWGYPKTLAIRPK